MGSAGQVLKRASRLFHTARYLRPSQVGARALLRLWRPLPRERAAPARRAPAAAPAVPVAHPASLVGPLQFSFLHEVHAVGARADWNAAARGKLWLYNLHYFDDLNAVGAAGRAAWHQQLLERWIAENPPGQGTGWEPYPLSRRVVNWIKWSLGGGTLDPAALHSLAAQARWLPRRFEWHLRGNHLLANAKALIFAGSYFSGPEAAAWLAQGMRVFERQLREQVLADGGHFELSPMYHALVLEDVLDVCNILQAAALPLPQSWPSCARRMGEWLRALTHPDGEIAFFNDAAFGVAATPAQLAGYAGAVLGMRAAEPPGTRLLADSGYARIECGNAVLLADCAAVGPDYLPAHAHADTLSFELSLDAARVVVNSGTSVYGSGPERQRQRGTAAHSTLSVDGENSSEVWHGFRVARRARTRGVALQGGAGEWSLTASHDGYRRLAGHNIHARTWRLRPGSLTIEDHVLGTCRSAVAHFHLHPEVSVAALSADARSAVTRSTRGPTLRWSFSGCARLENLASSWHPEFGVALPARCLSATARGAVLTTRIEWD